MSATDYVRYIYLEYLLDGQFDELFSSGWIDEHATVQAFRDALRKSVANYGYIIDESSYSLVESVMDALVKTDSLLVEGDDYTGRYYKMQVGVKDNFIKGFFANDQVSQRISRLGEFALANALKKASEELGWQGSGVFGDYAGLPPANAEVQTSDNFGVPASDRLVSLSHNQIAEAEGPLTEIINAIENDNGVPEELGLRERLIGQIRAARELVRCGEYRAYLMYELLVRALNEIINKYGNPTIVALANALLGAVVSRLLQE